MKLTRPRRSLLCALALFLGAGAAMAWDVEHDVIAHLSGEFMPAEVRKELCFQDFEVLMSNCHFPDMTEWPCKNGKRRFHTAEDMARYVSPEDIRALQSVGFVNGNWFHSPRGKAALMGMLARAFANGKHVSAAFYISALTHAVSDESALNHPPLLGFFRYSKLPGIDFTMRKVEDGAKNVFGFRSDGHIVHLVRQRLAAYVPEVPSGSFADAVMAFSVDIAVRQSAFSGVVEGRIAFAPQAEAEVVLAELVELQVRTIENIIMTCWNHRSPTAALPDGKFDARFAEGCCAAVQKLDPSSQSVFKGIFDSSLDPAQPKGVVGLVCEPYSRGYGQLSFPGRILTAACGRTLRANGYAVRGLPYWTLAKNGFPDPEKVPVMLMCIGGSGYMSSGPNAGFAAAARVYRDRGGRLVVIGGEDRRDITGFAATMCRRGNLEVPASSAWSKDECSDACAMALVATSAMKRLASGRFSFLRDPNFDGFCKPVCRMETPVGNVLLELDNGKASFPVAVARGNVVWLPEYALMPYLFIRDDPKMPLDALPLDDFGEKVLLDAVDLLTVSGRE